MVAEVFAGLSAFKTMFDMAKGLKDINDAAIRNGAVIELQEQILAAQEAQAALIQRVGELEKQVAGFETWKTEKEHYDLKELGEPGVLAYMLKPDVRGTKPPHWACTNCYSKRHISILLNTGESRSGRRVHRCPNCKFELATRFPPAWSD